MLNPQRFSLLLASFLWLSVSYRIGARGLQWLEPYFIDPDWHLGLLLLSAIVGFLKANTVLKKAAKRNLANLGQITSKVSDYFFGWLKLFGSRGLIMVLIMIGLGIGLRYLRHLGFDSYNLFGFIYMAIAIGLGLSSWFYFDEFLKYKAPSNVL